jgi:heme o synthase
MERISKLPFKLVLRNYILLSKPGIIFGNGVSAVGGFALASKGHFQFFLFLSMMLGLSMVIASACIFNNYIDREIDAKMKRTRNRVLVKGLISIKNAMVYAFILLVCGCCILLVNTNLLTTVLSLSGFAIYVFLYSFLKHSSIHATLVGSFAGAIPPVVGYCSLTGSLDKGALILFLMFAMWQMPHFFAIALYRLEDYKAASIPVLPLIRGSFNTKTQMLLYIIGFMGASSLLTVFGYTGYVFLFLITLLSLYWIYLCIKGYQCKNDHKWARKMFLFSLVVVMVLSISIPFNTL